MIANGPKANGNRARPWCGFLLILKGLRQVDRDRIGFSPARSEWQVQIEDDIHSFTLTVFTAG